MFRDGAERFLVFGVGAERFAVPLAAVDEVMETPVVQRIPDAPRPVLGVTSIRGSLVTFYDPRPLLNVVGQASAAGTANDAALIFAQAGSRSAPDRDAERRVGLTIDALHDTIVVEPEEVRSAPGADASDRVLVGVVRRGSELIAILDASALLDAAIAAGDSHGERT
jgi:purine-binding chemotaxis protein CheW